MANPNIGTVICPLCGDIADVRKDKNGRLYYAGDAGLITPKTKLGQDWLKQHASLEGQEPEPERIEEIEPEYTPEPTANVGLFTQLRNASDDLINDVFGGTDG